MARRVAKNGLDVALDERRGKAVARRGDAEDGRHHGPPEVAVDEDHPQVLGGEAHSEI